MKELPRARTLTPHLLKHASPRRPQSVHKCVRAGALLVVIATAAARKWYLEFKTTARPERLLARDAVAFDGPDVERDHEDEPAHFNHSRGVERRATFRVRHAFQKLHQFVDSLFVLLVLVVALFEARRNCGLSFLPGPVPSAWDESTMATQPDR